MIEKNSDKKDSIKQPSIVLVEEPKKASIINKDEDQVVLDSGDEEDNYEDD